MENDRSATHTRALFQPVLRPLPDGKSWELVDTFFYTAEDREIIRVPRGFTCDLASIPRLLHSFFPKHGRHTPAAIIHDYCYKTRRCTRQRADALFLEAMKAYGVKRMDRWAKYLAVRAFGWQAWID